MKNIFAIKSKLLSLLLLVGFVSVFSFGMLGSASAIVDVPGGGQTHGSTNPPAPTPTKASECTKDFLGLVPWYGYLPAAEFSPDCSIIGFQLLTSSASGHGTSDIVYILLAIVDDLLRISGIVAVGFIVYAAVQYISSQGNPEQSSKAQSTLINALVGLVIASLAVIIVQFIGTSLT